MACIHATHPVDQVTTSPVSFFRRCLLSIFGSAIFAFVCVLGMPQSRADDSTVSPLFRRGINIHHTLNWAAADANGRYLYPPFAAGRYALPDGDLAVLKQAGFDFIRLTVDPGPFLQATGGADRDAADAALIDRITRIRRQGLSVIVDLHPVSQVMEFAPHRYVSSDDPAFIARYADYLKQTAAQLQVLHDPRVALELLNEPATRSAAAAPAWQKIVEMYYDAARSAAPDLNIVVSGGLASFWSGLVDLDPTRLKGPNTYFTFHNYWPSAFTHQGEGARWRQLPLANVHYPLGVSIPPDTATATRARIAQLFPNPDDRARAEKESFAFLSKQIFEGLRYALEGGYLRNLFDAVSGWADTHGIPRDRIVLGEFGATIGASSDGGVSIQADRLRWITEMCRRAEAAGFAWAYWAYKGNTRMSLLNTDNRLDASTLEALGLAVE